MRSTILCCSMTVGVGLICMEGCSRAKPAPAPVHDAPDSAPAPAGGPTGGTNPGLPPAIWSEWNRHRETLSQWDQEMWRRQGETDRKDWELRASNAIRFFECLIRRRIGESGSYVGNPTYAHEVPKLERWLRDHKESLRWDEKARSIWQRTMTISPNHEIEVVADCACDMPYRAEQLPLEWRNPRTAEGDLGAVVALALIEEWTYQQHVLSEWRRDARRRLSTTERERRLAAVDSALRFFECLTLRRLREEEEDGKPPTLLAESPSLEQWAHDNARDTRWDETSRSVWRRAVVVGPDHHVEAGPRCACDPP